MYPIGETKANPAQVTPITFITYARIALEIASGIKRTTTPVGIPTTTNRANRYSSNDLVLSKAHNPTIKIESSLSTFLVKTNPTIKPKGKKGAMQEKRISLW